MGAHEMPAAGVEGENISVNESSVACAPCPVPNPDAGIDFALLPPPPIPAEVDLSNVPRHQISIKVLLRDGYDSDCSDQVARIRWRLLMQSYLQRPAGSLPNDDTKLRLLGGYLGDHWGRIRQDVMKGWILHSDGRLYHSVAAQDAHIAYEKLINQRRRKQRERANAGDDEEQGVTVTVTPQREENGSLYLYSIEESVPRACDSSSAATIKAAKKEKWEAHVMAFVKTRASKDDFVRFYGGYYAGAAWAKVEMNMWDKKMKAEKASRARIQQ